MTLYWEASVLANLETTSNWPAFVLVHFGNNVVLTIMLIFSQTMTGIISFVNFFSQFQKYSEHPMLRYSDDFCTSTVVCTAVGSHYCFSIKGGIVVAHPPVLRVLYPTRPLSLPPCSGVSRAAVYSILCATSFVLNWKCWLHALRHSSDYRCVGSACDKADDCLKFLLLREYVPVVFHSWPCRSLVLLSSCFCCVIDLCARCAFKQGLCIRQ